MSVCCVEGCEGPTNPDPVFYPFPSSRLLRKRWLDAINSESVAADAVVCNLHFSRGDFERVGGHARLKSRVVPSRKIGPQTEDEDSGSESSVSSESSKIIQNNTKNNKNVQNANEDNQNAHKDVQKIHNDNEVIGKFTSDDVNVINDSKNGTENNKNNDQENNCTEINKSSSEKVNEHSDNSLNNVDREKLNLFSEKNNKDNCQDNEKFDKDVRNVDKDSGKNDIDNGQDDKGNSIFDKNNIKDGDGDSKNDKSSPIDDKGGDKDDKDAVKDDKDDVKNDKDDVKDDKDGVKDDKGKVKKLKTRRARSKMTALRAINGRRAMSSESSSSDSVGSSPTRGTEVEGTKEDIEESLQYYFIENKKTERQVAAMTDVLLEEQEKRDEEMRRLMEQGLGEGEASEADGDPTEPMFIELSVGQDGRASSQPAPENDCLMLLESVQCEVDPTLLLEAREEEEANMEHVDLDDEDAADDDDEPIIIEKKKPDPISLLTSSDEDDVILQEPKIDTVEVSSPGTSEDDMPLVKLVNPSNKPSNPIADQPLTVKRAKTLINQLLWGRNDFYCVHCRYTTSSASDYSKHMTIHSKIIQLCHECGFTTCSQHQMQRHKQKHKNEKRFKCQMCNYSAKHRMSLVYHMKTHNASINEVELAICGTFEPSKDASAKSKLSEKRKKSKKSRASDSQKKYHCDSCSYKTDRRSDMKRHRGRLHGDAGGDDDEYVP